VIFQGCALAAAVSHHLDSSCARTLFSYRYRNGGGRFSRGCSAFSDEPFYLSTEHVQSAPSVDTSFADLLSDLAASLQSS
jgi:hypothetical protein